MYIVLPRALFLPILVLAWAGTTELACQAQGLPNTNFGKFVHQPGDNQYEERAQRERHAPSASVQRVINQNQSAAAAAGQAAAAAAARPAWVPTPAPQMPDTSVQPIVSDEPIKPAGFPPLPDRPDLPVTSAWARAASGPPNMGGIANNSGGGDNGGFNRRVQGVHEHYYHYMPGACIKQSAQPASDSPGPGPSAAPSSGGGGGGGSSGGGGNAGGTHGYYKCGTPDSYAVSTNRRAPAASGEPGLNPRLDSVQRAEPPTPVVVSQPATQEISSQDLSLPDDDYNAQNPSTTNTKNRRMGQTVGRNAKRAMYRVGTRAFYTGTSLLHYH